MNLQHLLTATTATAFVGAFSIPAQAANLFGNTGIQFDQTTTVEFKFVQANNQFQSVLGIYQQSNSSNPVETLFQETKRSDTNVLSKDWKSTCGQANSAIANCTRSFTFQAGVLYTLGLFSAAVDPGNTTNGPRVPTVYSTDSLNPAPPAFDVASQRRASFSSSNPFLNTVIISFEDGAYKSELEDLDFNDFEVSARVVPVPPALGGLTLLGGLLLSRRRRQQFVESKAR